MKRRKISKKKIIHFVLGIFILFICAGFIVYNTIKIHALMTTHQKLDAEIELLEKQCTTLENENQELKDKVESTDSNISKTEEELNNTKEELKNYNEKVNSLNEIIQEETN